MKNTGMRRSCTHLFILFLFFNVFQLFGQDLSIPEIKKLDSLARFYNNTGVDYAMAGDIEKAGTYFLKSLRIKQSIPGFDKNRLASGYLNLANIKNQLGYIDSALLYFKMADGFIVQADNPNRSTQGAIYTEMGGCFIKIYDFQSALPLIKKGISLIENNPTLDYYKLILAKLKLSFALMINGSLDEAISQGVDALVLAKKHKPDLVSSIEISFGNVLHEKKEYAKAIAHYQEAERLIKNKQGEINIELISLYNNIGSSFQNLLKFEKAELYYEKALKMCKTNSISSYSKKSLIYNNLGNLKIKQELPEHTILLITKSLQSNSRDSLSSQSLLIANNFYSLTQAASSFQELGNAYTKLFNKNRDVIYAYEASQAYRKAISLSEDIRLNLYSEDDKLLVNKKYNNYYESAIESAFQFSKIDSSFLEEAFKLISKNKAAILHELISSNKGLSISGIPVELQNQERSTKQRFDYLTERLYEERKTNNSTQIKKTEEQLFNIQNEYRAILKKIETNYPKYYNLKYDTSSVSISQLQKNLSNDKLVIDYYKTDSTLYAFAISKHKVNYSIQKLNSFFYSNLSQFREELVPDNFNALSSEDVKSFANSSYYLYSILLKPFESEMKGKKLVIVPHNELISIPFIALVTSESNSYQNYYSLPYLVFSNSITYSLSSKLYIDQVNAPVPHFLTCLSVAPSYKEAVIKPESREGVYRQDLSDLPGAKLESNEVRRVFRGSSLMDQQATERNFKKIASKFNILHLAMHTFIDDKNPNYSKLIFTQSADSIEDGYLNAYEIYNLQLNCRLAILSACRSGDGNLIKGEGIISLARGFFYAGCPSLVCTQWRVDDNSGSELVSEFAKIIKKGKSIGCALQTTQINFLKKSDPLRSHPYFWAAYQVLGCDKPIKPENINIFYIMLISFIVISVSGYIYLAYFKGLK